MSQRIPEILDADPMKLFELVEILGKGSYGSVFKGRVMENGEVVAVKVISLEEGDDLEDVRREIRILQECNHPNIVKYYGSYMHNDTLWIVMEYCGGGSVQDLLMNLNKPLEEPQIAFIAREALKGLAYLHSIKKIHRDIKGGNILLTDEGHVKLADFGVSGQLVNTFSKRNTFIGTPFWMAPEVIMEAGYDGRADVWSMGITCIEMAELEPPNSDVHPMRVLFMIPRDPPPKLRAPTKWSKDFVNFLEDCLIKDQVARPPAGIVVKHPFIANAPGPQVMVDVVQACKQFIAQRGPLNFDTESESSASVGGGGGGAKLPKGTVVRPNGDGSKDTVGSTNSSGTVRRPSHHPEPGIYDTTGRTSSTGTDEYGTTVYTSQADLSGLDNAAPVLRRAADSNNASSVQTLYRKDTTIRIPFLHLSDVSPDALLDPERYKVNEAMQKVSHQPIAVGQYELDASLSNLVRTMDYHRELEENPLPGVAVDREAAGATLHDLTTTVKTIFRV